MKMNMQQLTVKWVNDASSQNIGDVVGAAMNVMMTAFNAIPDKQVMKAAAKTMQDMAQQLETMSSKDRH